MQRFDLGPHKRAVSTKSAEAQRWFDMGLNWCFGFNFVEGTLCFQKSLEADPECVMGHWGVAYGSGPFYNLTWREMSDSEATLRAARAFRHIERARSLAHRGTPVERALIEALANRFQKPHAVSADEYDRWDNDYAAAMREVYLAYPGDHDVAALYAEALITRAPRRLWNLKSGEPENGSDILEAMRVCENAMASADLSGRTPNPAVLHMHIHALEMSNFPERAMRAADGLSAVETDAGHLNHMPGHIYVLCGDYERARVQRQVPRLCRTFHLLHRRMLPRPPPDDAYLHVARLLS